MKNTILFFAISILFFSCKKKEEKVVTVVPDCIEVILKKDSELGTIRNHACEKTSLSRTIDNYVSSIKKLDYTECPTEFTQAFSDHQEAWLATKIVTNKHSDLRGEMHDLFDAINKTADSTEFKVLVKGIWDTWAEVENASKLN